MSQSQRYWDKLFNRSRLFRNAKLLRSSVETREKFIQVTGPQMCRRSEGGDGPRLILQLFPVRWASATAPADDDAARCRWLWRDVTGPTLASLQWYLSQFIRSLSIYAFETSRCSTLRLVGSAECSPHQIVEWVVPLVYHSSICRWDRAHLYDCIWYRVNTDSAHKV